MNQFAQTVRGYCPEFDDDAHPVTVFYRQAQVLGGFTYPPEPVSFKCREMQNCRHYEQHDCPLLESIFSR